MLFIFSGPFMGDLQWPVLVCQGLNRRTLSKEIWRILVLVWSSHSSRISPWSFHHVPSCQCCHWNLCRILCSMLSDRDLLYFLTSIWLLCTPNAGRNLYFSRFKGKKQKKTLVEDFIPSKKTGFHSFLVVKT